MSLCKVCGGETRSVYGVCRKTSECKRAWANVRNRQRRAKLKAVGLCRYCGQPVEQPGKQQCNNCLVKDSTAARNRRRQRPAYYMYHNRKRYAEQNKIPFDITEQDILDVMTDTCPVFGIPLQQGHGTIQDTSPTLDRIVPDLGYVVGNIVVMSRLANRLKNNATLNQLVMLGDWAKNVRT